MASRRKKVGFHLSDLVATFRKDEAPASLLGRPREAKRNFAFNLRPILKSPVQKSLNIQLSSASFKARRHRHVPISMHRAQDDESPHPWQLVRKRRWWRKSLPGIQIPHTSQRPGLAFFKAKLVGRCFNCLAKDHIKSLSSETRLSAGALWQKRAHLNPLPKKIPASPLSEQANLPQAPCTTSIHSHPFTNLARLNE